MKLLTFDTAFGNCALNLNIDNRVVFSKTLQSINKQSEEITFLAQEALDKAGIWYDDLDFVATNIGPGSFNGVRIGIAAAKAIAIKNQVKLVPVTSFEAMAYPYFEQQNEILVAIDALRGKIFFDILDSELKSKNQPKLLDLLDPQTINELDLEEREYLICGNAKDALAKFIESKHHEGGFKLSPNIDEINIDNIAKIALKKAKNNETSLLKALYIRPCV